MKKLLATTTLAATVIGGGLLAGTAIAAAQDDQSSSWIDDALGGLVDDGVLTDAQVDAVEAALREARPVRPDHGPGGPGQVLEELGLDPATVRDGLRSGQSLGEIAEANGISADDVVQALIDDHAEHLASAVDSGRIDAATAAERKAAFAAQAQAIVDGTARPDGPGFGGPGFGGHHHGPFGGPLADGDDAAAEPGA